jgi:hypothetical protein
MAIYAAKEAFTFDQNGVPRFFSPGTLVSDDDPGYKGREHLFEPVEVRAAATETATSAPGETRARRPFKKTEPTKKEES